MTAADTRTPSLFTFSQAHISTPTLLRFEKHEQPHQALGNLHTEKHEALRKPDHEGYLRLLAQVAAGYAQSSFLQSASLRTTALPNALKPQNKAWEVQLGTFDAHTSCTAVISCVPDSLLVNLSFVVGAASWRLQHDLSTHKLPKQQSTQKPVS